MTGYRQANGPNAAMFTREVGADLFIVVSRIGPSVFGSWGFVIWRGNSALAGGKDFSWTADDACRAADQSLAIVQAPGWNREK